MLYYAFLFSLTAFMLCLNLFLMQRIGILQKEFYKLRGEDVNLQLNQQISKGVDGRTAKTSKTREDTKPSGFQRAQSSPKISSRRVKREQSSCRAPISLLQLKANTNKQPDRRGNITVIPWTVSAQQGNRISQKENRIVVQEDGYYLVFGQVLFESQNEVMGHVIQSWSSTKTGRRSTELQRCLQKMPNQNPGNTCYTAGMVHLLQNDELELVVPSRPSAVIIMETDATFFGAIQLK